MCVCVCVCVCVCMCVCVCVSVCMHVFLLFCGWLNHACTQFAYKMLSYKYNYLCISAANYSHLINFENFWFYFDSICHAESYLCKELQV